MEKPIKVWIAGAGYLGRPLANKLVEHGFDVIASSRKTIAEAWWRQWDVNQNTLPQDLQDACVWVMLLPPSSSEHYAERLSYWCQQAEKLQVSHLIFTSSTSVYGSQARHCDESSEAQPETASAKAIVLVEQAVLNSRLEKKTVLRLGGLYDDERHPVKRLSGRENIAHGNHSVNMLHKHEAVQALFDTISQSYQGVLNVVQRSHPSRAEFYTQEARRLGLPLPQFTPNDSSSGKTVDSRYGYWSF